MPSRTKEKEECLFRFGVCLIKQVLKDLFAGSRLGGVKLLLQPHVLVVLLPQLTNAQLIHINLDITEHGLKIIAVLLDELLHVVLVIHAHDNLVLLDILRGHELYGSE